MCENTFARPDRGALLKAPGERPQEHRHLLPLYHATVGLKAPNDEGVVPEQRHSFSWKWRQRKQVTRMISFMFLLHVWLENTGTFSNVSMSPHYEIVSGSNFIGNRHVFTSKLWLIDVLSLFILLSCSMWLNHIEPYGCEPLATTWRLHLYC